MTSFYSRVCIATVSVLALLVIALPSIATAQTTARVSTVDMIVETDGHVHALYTGKLDPGYQNEVKVVAIPHLYTSAGSEVDAKNIFFQWRKNGLVIQADSGYGKQSLVMDGGMIPRAFSVTVDIRSRDGVLTAKGITTVEPVAPFITFYVDDPLYGPLFQKAVGSSLRIGSEREISITAIPFGFNKRSSATDNISRTWLINGTAHPELSTNENVILRSPDEAGGSATVQLTMRNLQDILQGATAGFNTVFTAPNTSSANSSF